MRAFVELGVDYYVGGSFASSIQGIPRTTQDADFVADLEDRHVLPLVRLLEGEFYLDDERIRHAVSRRSSFNVIHLQRHFKLDVYVAGVDPFSREELRRAESVTLDGSSGATLRVASAEDVVLQKLRWYRMGGERSERQWLDVLGVLKVQRPTIDRAYLATWAAELAVADLLASALEDAGYS